MKKRYILILLFIGFGITCKKPKRAPLPVLPPITQEGLGTIGFVMGGDIWVPGNYTNASNQSPGADYTPNIGLLIIR